MLAGALAQHSTLTELYLLGNQPATCVTESQPNSEGCAFWIATGAGCTSQGSAAAPDGTQCDVK